MQPETYVVFPSPVTLRISRLPNPRPRAIADQPTEPVAQVFERLLLWVRIDPIRREILAHLPPIPAPLPLYSQADYSGACGDTMDEHAARVLQLLGSDPATVLQLLIDGQPIPDPPQRVPREIANWRGKVVLAMAGHLPAAEAFIDALPDPQRTVARAAWDGDAKFSRNSQTVLALGQALNLSAAGLDSLFIAADSIIV